MKRLKSLTKEEIENILIDYSKNIPPKEIYEKYNIYYLILEKLLKINNIEHRIRKYKYEFNENFFKILNENSLWILGWLYSDGNLSYPDNSHSIRNSDYYFAIALKSDDVDVLKSISKLLEIQNHEIKYYTQKSKFKNYPDKNCEMCQLRLFRKSIVEDLKQLGLTKNKSLTINYPNFLKSKEEHFAFLRGIFEGDGHASIKSGKNGGFNCSISTGSINFAEGLVNFLKSVNIDSSIYYKNGKCKQVNIISGRENIIKFLDAIYKNGNAEYYLSRKFQAYLEIKNAYQQFLVYKDMPKTKARFGTKYFQSPDGKIYITNCTRLFAEEFGVNQWSLFHAIRIGEKYSPKNGWKIPSLNLVEKSIKENSIIEKIYKTY